MEKAIECYKYCDMKPLTAGWIDMVKWKEVIENTEIAKFSTFPTMKGKNSIC